MPDKREKMKILNRVQNGLKLLLGNVLKVKSPNMSPLILKSLKKSPIDVATFFYFSWNLKIYLINLLDLPTKTASGGQSVGLCRLQKIGHLQKCCSFQMRYLPLRPLVYTKSNRAENKKKIFQVLDAICKIAWFDVKSCDR